MRIVIGVVGNMGAGKTRVAQVFKDLGAEVIDADRLGWECLRKGTLEYKEIIKRFGTTILEQDGKINRRRLGKIVFSSPEKIRALNRIVHPKIVREIKEKVEKFRGVIVIDAALLLDWDLGVDKVIVVTAPEKLKIERMERRGWTREEVILRLKSQRRESELVKKTDYVIENTGSLKELKSRCKNIWNLIFAKVNHKAQKENHR